ncbi:suppressor of IKBKE 1 isoform X3 [Leptonychotes weddellii]|uniref:Suppressor of IKBKE 1 n=1 Tax=Leptonychotes weddellii TaxID=9713 RepID=A0A7F8PWB2_LEPWE|nr:suppressor of IKBKE 1 isoform X3 [Leptonychotes weddellii]XP_032276783.1 suppressor of IKBKE 1 isoform X3 [Phoca vitulina]
MSCTIEKILTDAKTLLERLREHDAAAESLVDQSAALHRRVAAMREAGTALPDQVGQRVGGRARRICAPEGWRAKEELWVSLEEHQDALELIMSKYRKQMLQLMVAKKAVDAEPVLKAHQSHSAEIESQIDRICEMGEVMRKAVQVDDDQFCKIQEKLAQLELENKELRELLSISSESLQVRKENSMATASQAIK